MSTLFDFTYKLNSETAQNQILSNVLAASAKKEYQPISHFFVDETKLAAILPANYATDAFGPVTGSETTKYRTTSKVRAIDANPVKVFAICDGQVMIQPQSGDNTKVNLILKPTASYAPLKIKYFVYRGINKADLIGNNILVPVTNNDPNQPIFLKKLWDQYIAFNTGLKDPATGDTLPAPTEFPSFLIGYKENESEDVLIENYFTKKEITISHQIPMCKEGEHLGNFTGEIGLEIVLDYGDYQLQNQEELFKFDLKFAREKEHIFDTASQTNAIKIKRLKEYIHQFMDAAAFWGSHIECGTIETVATPAGIKTNNDIFTKIVSKYQTQNKIYVYIQGESVRSYNYYDTTRKVYGFATTSKLNETSGWPITIEEIVLSTATTTFKEGKSIQLEYSVASAIPETDRHVAIDIIVPDNNTSNYPLVIRPKNPAGTLPAILTDKTPAATIKFPVNGTKSCATFLFLYANLKQEVPLKKYFNDLFPVNLNTNFKLPTTGVQDMSYTVTYDKSRLVNLDDIIEAGAVIQNKVVFDNGKGQPVAGVAPRKNRRLHMAVLKRNSIHNQEFDNLNIDTVIAGIVKETKSHEDYVSNHYGDKDFSIYKGTFTDGTAINSLTLFHQTNITKKNSYFHLGITEEEYNKLVYGQTTVPVVTPPAPIPQVLPNDADNIFFHLEEDTTFSHQSATRYKLGFKFEDNAGNLTTLFPSSPTNQVLIYTIDGAYFFSEEYSQFQEFYEEHPKVKVDFRVKLPYNGEFGFDWMRVGDTLAPGDIDYKNHVGKLYTDALHTNLETDTNTYSGHFLKHIYLYKKLEFEYKPFPTQCNTTRDVERYYVPLLTIYPPYSPHSSPSPDLDRQSIFTPPFNDDINRLAELTLKVEVTSEPVRLELDYDLTKFSIPPTIIPKGVGKRELNISVRCLKEFGTEELIKVRAYYNNSSGILDPIGKIVGVLRIKPNSKSLRYSKKILLVNVHTDIVGAGSPPSLIYTVEEQAKFLKKFLRQTLSTPIIETTTIDLVANPDAVFNSDFIDTDASGVKFLKDQDVLGKFIIQYLYDYLTTTGPTPVGTVRYADYFKVFFFNDNGQVGRFGFALQSLNLLADFTNNLPSTTTHEFLHTAKVEHTFANYEGSEYAKFTYDPMSTDNIMDYSDFGASPPIPTISIYDWQSKIAITKFDPEP